MDNVSILFRLDEKDTIWEFYLFGKRMIKGKILNYSLDPQGSPISVVVQDDLGNFGEIPWKNVQYIIHTKEKAK